GFGATEIMRIPPSGGTVGHAEIKIGEAIIMLAAEFHALNHRSPQALGGTPVSMMVYVPDVDTLVKRAIGAGAKVLEAVENRFYGDRSGNMEDPFGHHSPFAPDEEDLP